MQARQSAGRETTDPALIPLSPTGERQAVRVAKAFERSPDLILSSPVLRARQTAQATVDRFSTVRFEESPIQEFTYLGRLHGRSTTGAQRRPLVDAYWNAADPSYRDDDKSESFLDVYARAGRLLTLLSQQDGAVAVFTHGLFTRIVLWVILGGGDTPEDMRRFHEFRTTYLIPNCSVIELRLHPGPRILGAVTSHLPPELRTGYQE